MNDRPVLVDPGSHRAETYRIACRNSRLEIPLAGRARLNGVVNNPKAAISNETKSAITQAQQEFTSRLVQNVRYPLSIVQEDQAMKRIKR